MKKTFTTLRKVFSKPGPLGWKQQFPDICPLLHEHKYLCICDGLVYALEQMVTLEKWGRGVEMT